MSTSILITRNDHVQPVALWASELVQATGSDDPFASIKIAITSLCFICIVACVAGAVIEHKRFGELVYSGWVRFPLLIAGACILSLLLLYMSTHL